jgi:hypothetical protein
MAQVTSGAERHGFNGSVEAGRAPSRRAGAVALETFVYDDAIVRMFMVATIVWGLGS